MSRRFLTTELVVRLAVGVDARQPPQWSTVEHRALEDQVLKRLHALAETQGHAIDPRIVDAAIVTGPRTLGADQVEAAQVLCGGGGSLRAVTAPAGYGKTTALHAAVTAQHAAGRNVVVVAPTHKAVAELRANGIDAQTVGRFCVQLDDAAVAPSTTVVIDEVSQLGTRQAAVIVDAVAAAPDAQLWCVGDVRQTQSVAAGGLGVEIQRLADRGAIPAAGLAVNRRQQHPADRRALAELRGGRVDDSRTIRTEHGWEHQLDSPSDTRQALAEAVVRDGDRLGRDQVAVLAVSHTDCEDVADRIRSVLATRGELRGPVVCGLGWGPGPRYYCAGDRVLLHANLDPANRVFNGATGTLVSVSHAGADVLFDDGHHTFLSAEVIAGTRADGTPNLSHAWARTIDGAQGGTWAQVHLLGTPALDQFTGYVGQSRGQQPTHTWHTGPDADHPRGLLADQRVPSEVVTDAMRRAEPKTFAADDDPWTFDRTLRTERAEHTAVSTTRPPDVAAELEAARRRSDRAAEEHHWATEGVDLRRRERDRLGTLHRLRRGGRADIERADAALAAAQQRLTGAAGLARLAQRKTAELEQVATARAAWDHEHGWRIERVAEIDRQLDRHWAAITLQAVRADDPLAFGIDKLRGARRTYQAELYELQRSLPEDRHRQLTVSEHNLHRAQEHVRYAQRALADAKAQSEPARQRHWGRRDHTSVRASTFGLERAEASLAQAKDTQAAAQQRVEREQQALQRRARALRDTDEQRHQLGGAINDITTALDRTRPERVAAATLEPTGDLWLQLGPPPSTRGGLNAWCGLAERLEAAADHGITRGVRSGHGLEDLVRDAPTILEIAQGLDPTPARDPLVDRTEWQPALEATAQVLAAEPPTPIEQGLGLEL